MKIVLSLDEVLAILEERFGAPLGAIRLVERGDGGADLEITGVTPHLLRTGSEGRSVKPEEPVVQARDPQMPVKKEEETGTLEDVLRRSQSLLTGVSNAPTIVHDDDNF